MSKTVSLVLDVKKDAEPFNEWLFKDPASFLIELSKRLIVKGSIDGSEVVISDDIPSSSDRLKIWIKTSLPYGIGKLINGTWEMCYFGGMPTNIPFIKKESLMKPLPNSVREISNEEIKRWGLPKIYSDDNVEVVYKWYIFEPKELNNE